MATLQSQSRLDILLGPMYASKTSALLRKMSQFAEMGLQSLYINHGIDTRAKTDYSTHSKMLREGNVDIPTLKTINLNSVDLELVNAADVIGIDEAQFFDEELVPFVLKLVEEYHKYVIVAGLDGTYKRKKFGHILDLIPYADNVTKLHAYCKPCSLRSKSLRSAIFTHYNGDSNDIIVVGGADTYQAVCRKCYLDLNKVNPDIKLLCLETE